MGPPTLRRTALDQLAGPHTPMYAVASDHVHPRPVPAQQPAQADPRWRSRPRPAALLGRAVPGLGRGDSGGAPAPAGVARRASGGRSPEIAPAEDPLTLAYGTNAPLLPGESPRDALARRLHETAEKEAWNGTTLVGPHRDDLVFRIGGRDLTTFASRGQQRTAILALKLAELDLLTALDGRPPLLLLDDVFSELDPLRRGHLVRRIAELPQALVTTTVPGGSGPGSASAGTRLAGGSRGRRGCARSRRARRERAARKSGARTIGGRAGRSGRRGAWSDWAICCPDAARQLGLEERA